MEERDRKEEVESWRPQASPPTFPKVCVLGSYESRSQSVIVCPLEEGEKEEEGRLPQMRILSEGRGTFFEVWCREKSWVLPWGENCHSNFVASVAGERGSAKDQREHQIGDQKSLIWLNIKRKRIPEYRNYVSLGVKLWKFSFLCSNMLSCASIAVDIICFCFICRMLFKDHPHLSMDG